MKLSNKATVTICVVLVAFSGWFYSTPYLAVQSMRSAAEAKDAAKLSSYVNFPALKDSLKASFNAKLASNVVNKEAGNSMSALGAAIAAAVINPLIEALVTPESLAMMMKGQNPDLNSKIESTSTESEVDISLSYEAFDRFLVTVRKKKSKDEPVGLVFNRDGLFSWKLSAIRLPM